MGEIQNEKRYRFGFHTAFLILIFTPVCTTKNQQSVSATLTSVNRLANPLASTTLKKEGKYELEY